MSPKEYDNADNIIAANMLIYQTKVNSWTGRYAGMIIGRVRSASETISNQVTSVIDYSL